jgi:MscS family membrane protein
MNSDSPSPDPVSLGALSGLWQKFAAVEIGMFSLGDLLAAFGIILAALLLRGFLTRILFTRLKELASRSRMEYDDRIVAALEKPGELLVLVFGVFFAFAVLPLQSEWQRIIGLAFRGAIMLLVFWGALRLVDVMVDALTAALGTRASDGAIHGFAPLIKRTTRIFLIVVAVVMVVDNLGFDIGGILATLGVGGLAFAIAAKDTVANLYGSIALILDRPFKVGDWIQVGNDVDGDVEEIGLRSTKVRTWPKTLISIPNAVLANEKINNWSRMPKRRVKQVVGVTYETPPDTMTAIVDDIREILRHDEGVNQEFILVNWTDFGSSSLDILVYYFTKTTKWLEYMEVRQRINTKMAKAIAARGSSVAFPTRTLYLEGEVARRLAGGADLPGDFGPQAPN